MFKTCLPKHKYREVENYVYLYSFTSGTWHSIYNSCIYYEWFPWRLHLFSMDIVFTMNGFQFQQNISIFLFVLRNNCSYETLKLKI